MTSGEGILGIAEQNRPLTRAERERFLAVLDEDGDLLDTLIGRGILYTGLCAPAFGHIRPGWLQETAERIEIFVPGFEIECDLGGRGGTAPGLRGDRPCNYCRENGGKWALHRYEPRRIPIADEAAQDAFRKWFRLHDRVGGHVMIQNKLQDLGERAGIERLSPRVLRHTFGVILVEKQFPVDVGVTLMGWSGSWAPTKYRAYGQYVEGENPFLCGAPKKRGGRCQEPVRTVGGSCWRHGE
jgi:integrase